MRGKVKFYDKQKGYGFITVPEGKDVFVHYTNTLDKIVTDDEVDFSVIEGERGPKAIDVKRVKSK